MSALPYLAWVLALSNFLPLQWQQVPNWGLWSPGLASLFPLPVTGVRDVFQKHYLIRCSTTESLLLLPMLSQSLVQGVNTSAFLICITSCCFLLRMACTADTGLLRASALLCSTLGWDASPPGLVH